MAPQDVARMWAEYMSALMKQLSAAEGAAPENLARMEARISELLQEVRMALSLLLLNCIICIPLLVGLPVLRILSSG